MTHPQAAALQHPRQTPGCGRMAAKSGKSTMRATSTERNPAGDGPRTTRPTFGLIAPSAEATAVVAAQPGHQPW